MYFNGIFALGIAAIYLRTGFEPLLLAVVSQHLIVLDQFFPWVRLDGYYVVADLLGVSDLFSRIKPVIASLIPGREPDPRVRQLKPWARAAVSALGVDHDRRDQRRSGAAVRERPQLPQHRRAVARASSFTWC